MLFSTLKSRSLAFSKPTIFSSHVKLIFRRYSSSVISYSSSLSAKPLSLNRLIFTSSIPTISSRTMSSKPQRNAFDVLMSSRSKRKPSQESSPQKRKTPEPSTPNSINPNQINPVIPGSNQTQGACRIENEAKNAVIEDLKSVNPSANDGSLAVVKKPRLTITPDESIAEVKKKAADFDPKKAAFWGTGEKVPFMFVAKGLDAISEESKRIAITEILCNMLRTVIEITPEDLVKVVYILANKIAPAHEGLELGIGEASIIKALAEAYGATEACIKSKYQELGDLGLVAKACRSSQRLMCKPEALTVAKVFDAFRTIATESGKDSQDKKKKRIKMLLVAATDCEPQYLIRLLQTKLRIGSAEQTLLTALGHAAVYAEKQSLPQANMGSRLEEAAKIVKRVYSVIPVYDKIVSALLAGGVWDLPNACSFEPGVPVGPMLAKPTKQVSEIFDKFQDMEFTCEYKYDGERAQIHYMENGSVEIYSRRAERNTEKFPDIVAAISRLKRPSVTSFVLDCELVAYDREKKKILPFQILITRSRKNVVASEIKVKVCIFAFDILYLNGQTLLEEQLDVRRQHLYNSFEEEPGFFEFAEAITSNDFEAIEKFLEASLDSSCEGLIIKTLNKDATYEPSKRSHNWLKLKKDYMDSIGDSLDLVPIAAFHGRGKRTGVYGAFLLACYDPNREEFQSICKIGTGFSEAMLEERSASLRSKVIPKPKPYYRYSDTLTPDVWFEPAEVWEVKTADLTISPVHCAATGIVDPNKGISLRFPRLLRVREDKSPEDSSSAEMVAEMYSAQKHMRDNEVASDDE